MSSVRKGAISALLQPGNTRNPACPRDESATGKGRNNPRDSPVFLVGGSILDVLHQDGALSHLKILVVIHPRGAFVTGRSSMPLDESEDVEASTKAASRKHTPQPSSYQTLIPCPDARRRTRLSGDIIAVNQMR